MSYLTLNNGIPDFSKAVISFWFRVPKKSLEACADKANDESKADRELAQTAGFPSGYVFSRMHEIVPLITFGPMFEGYQIKEGSGTPITYKQSFGDYTTGAGYSLHSASTSQTTTDGPRYNKLSKVLSNPSFIGVRSTWILDHDGEPTDKLDTSVAVRIQMKDFGSGSWVTPRPEYFFGDAIALQSGSLAPGVQTDVAWNNSFNACLKGGIYPGGTKITRVTLRDETELYAKQFGPQEVFESDFTIEDADGNGITITPDKWHHFLLSFDLSKEMKGKGAKFVSDQPDCTEGGDQPPRSDIEVDDTHKVESPCKMWMALDDVDRKEIIGDAEFLGMGPNDIASYNCRQAALGANSGLIHFKVWDNISGQVHIGYNDIGFGAPTWSYSPAKIPSAGHALGIPCIKELVDSIYQIEMSELQIFTDVILDTGVETNRRAFIDFEKDADGINTTRMKPVDPTKAPITDDNPDGMALTEKLLGKKPEVLLHGSNNWKTGYNTGTTGVETDEDGNIVKIPEGQFKPVAGIEQFKPDPSLIKTST